MMSGGEIIGSFLDENAIDEFVIKSTIERLRLFPQSTSELEFQSIDSPNFECPQELHLIPVARTHVQPQRLSESCGCFQCGPEGSRQAAQGPHAFPSRLFL